MSRIFLSHSSINNAEAVALRDWLASCGWKDLFLDLDPERGLKAGERWQAALKRAAERCEVVIFLISPAWRASRWCVTEFLLAKQMNKRIVGVIVDPIPLQDLPTELTVEWQLVDLTAGTRNYQATVTIPPGDQTATVAFSRDGLDRLRIGLMHAGLDASYFSWPPESDPDRAPYRGLKALEAEDAGIFFGRDGAIVLGIDKLRGLRNAAPPRLAVILGASGAGKSSFMRAGLLPRLARQDEHFIPLPVIRPDRAVITGETGLLASLEQALKSAGLAHTRAELRAAIAAGASGVAPLLSALVEARTPAQLTDRSPAPKPPTLVLPVDQAEELFLADGAREAGVFLGLLRDLTARDAPELIVLFTIRSDSFEQLQTVKELQGLRQEMLSLPPMPKGSFAEIIKGPAQRLEGSNRALQIEERLVDVLLSDIEEGDGKDALPLLAFTLERLYVEHGGDGNLKLSEYEALGRVKGSIEAAVERAFKAADSDPTIPKDRTARLALLRHGFVPWLAGIDPDTGAPRRRVAKLSEIPPASRPLIQHLVEQRLLATDVAKDTGEVTIEPAHEALLRQWGLLQGWLSEDMALLGVLERVKRASSDWEKNQKGISWLVHSGQRLKAAEQLADRPDIAANLEPRDRDYLVACRKAEMSSRLRTRGGLALVSLIIAGIVAGFLTQDRWLPPTDVAAHRVMNWLNVASKSEGSFKECSSCPEMAIVPAGAFLMGSPQDEAERGDDEDDTPGPGGNRVRITIPAPFAVSKFEVTADQWDPCYARHKFDPDKGCAAAASSKAGGGKHPAKTITWHDAQQYVSWLSQLTGQEYRLLSEAEWEYAARAGSTTRYSFEDNIGALKEHAWYADNSNQETHPVDGNDPNERKAPNAFGLYHMHGNVREWVQDCYHDSYSAMPTDGSAFTSGDCNQRVLRGGGAGNEPDQLRSASRNKNTPGTPLYGLRVARTLTPSAIASFNRATGKTATDERRLAVDKSIWSSAR